MIQAQHLPGLGHSGFFLSFIYMCIQCLGHFSPPPPRYQAETILPLSLIKFSFLKTNQKKTSLILGRPESSKLKEICERLIKINVMDLEDTVNPPFLQICFTFKQCWGLNSGPYAC
jgi:hypothetical protein